MNFVIKKTINIHIVDKKTLRNLHNLEDGAGGVQAVILSNCLSTFLQK